MSATIYLVRHGETDDNVSGVPQGLRDVPPNARGREQAEAVARWFDGREIASIISSPMTRTLEVARAIATGRAIEIETDERLVEFDQGDYGGESATERQKLQSFRFHNPSQKLSGSLMSDFIRLESQGTVKEPSLEKAAQPDG